MSRTTVLPFPLGEKRAATAADDEGRLEALLAKLGNEYEVTLGDGNDGTVRLMRLNLVAGVAAPAKLTFKLSTPNGAPDHDVLPVTAQTDRPAGIGIVGQEALDDDDFFFVITDGVATVIKGDDAANVTAGDYIDPDNDALTGRVFTNTTTFTKGVTIGRALGATTGAQEDLLIRILDKLEG
jgi:hypothetical protein